MFEFNYFLKRHGIRKPDQLVSPIMTPIELLDFPKSSIYHYQTDNPEEVGPSNEEPVFKNIKKPITLGQITDIGDFKGSPRRLPLQTEPLIRLHRVKNKRYRPLTTLDAAARDNFTLIVYCYALLPRLYRYVRSIYSDYFKWYNQQAAIWKNIGKIAQESDRHQFIKMKLPTILPSFPDLRIGSGEINQRIMKLFRDPESRFILEVWKWLGVTRKESLLAFVPEDKLSTVNIIFEESGKWVFVNLGLLNEWRKATKLEIDELEAANPGKEVEYNKKGLDSLELQKRFLKMLMVLFEVRTVTTTTKDVATLTKEEKAKQDQAVVVTQTTDIDTNKNTTTSEANVTELPPEANFDDDEEVTFDKTVDMDLDKELEELDKISKLVVPDDEVSNEQVVSDIFAISESNKLEDSVKNICDGLAETGLLSAAEYKRHYKLSETYKTLKAPDGKRTLEEYIKIPFKELEIHESKAIPEIKTVIDKTMLKSSLIDFDKRYITEVMERDVAGIVLNIQKAGISVTDYNVERVDDIMGSFQNYSVRVVPVEGAPSTLKFRLPVVDEDGFYVANGVKYRLRKQNGDLPIRKIANNKVALTSYYGKIFVMRNEKRVYDYGTWLRNSISLRGLDPEDKTITDLQPGNVFDNLFECPRMYGVLSMGFKTFRLTPPTFTKDAKPVTYDLLFDHKERETSFTDEELTAYEKNGSILIGRSSTTEVIVMDKNGTIYRGNKGNIFVIGTIETMLELDISKAPKEFAELKVLGKNIPIGLILGHEIGLEKLIKSLKIDYRRVPVGTRVNLQPDEYGLVFDDETLVFSKDDELATLILSGFIDYRDAIRNFSVYDFDRKDVYLNLLESKKIGIRYLREIELLYQMFIDPITYEILEEMKEPLTFRGLLLRSCEMLLSENHPDEIDPAFMRKKGYERFAGTVYSELVRSVRIHKGRIGRAKAPIEMNPNSIWINISQDPSKILVSEINPIQNLKEIESVTFGGNGGRSSRSMTRGTRVYHKNDMGTISESTVDSSDVGINTYTSADPQFTSLRGLSKRYDLKQKNPTSLLSTSALLSPGSDRDDPKRVNISAAPFD